MGTPTTDELEKLEKQSLVEAPHEDFERPAETFVPGPYYAAAEEVLAELEEGVPAHVAGVKASSKGLDFSVDRRDFMRLFTVATAATAAACVRRPVEKAVPYVHQPIDQLPGVPTFYSSTCGSCAASCGIVVKTREGRPIKLEGNPEHPVNQGALCGLGQAQLQALYHPERLKAPMQRHGQRLDPIQWDDVYSILGEAVKKTQKIGIFTGGTTGHRHEFFREVLERLGAPKTALYTWEPNSLWSSTARAHEIAFGKAVIPRVDIKHADLLVGIGSDCLEVGFSPVAAAKSLSTFRTYHNGKTGRFVQFETNLSMTGSNADKRWVIAPGSEMQVALLLVRALYENASSNKSGLARKMAESLLRKHQAELDRAYGALNIPKAEFDALAAEMLQDGAVLLVGGSSMFSQDATKLQLVGILGNLLIGSYEKFLFIDRGWMKPPVVSGDLERFLADAPQLDIIFVIDSDPIFTVPASWGLRAALEKIPTVVSIQAFPADTDRVAHFALPAHHALESWGDEEPVEGFWSIRQPVIRPTTDSRQAEDMLLWILATSGKNLPYADYHAYLYKKWEAVQQFTGNLSVVYDMFFKAVLRRGFIGKLMVQSLSAQLKDFSAELQELRAMPTGLQLLAPLDHRFHDGRGAHLPVLQETGDAVTTVTWDTWAAINPNTMTKLGLKRNQLVVLSTAAGKLTVPVYPLPGLHPDVIVCPRGNGRDDERSTISYNAGLNPLALFPKAQDPLSKEPVTAGEAVQLTATAEWFRLAALQKHHDIANRKDIVKKIDLPSLKHAKKKNLDQVPDLFPKLEESEYRWGMSIDLDKCTGCGACVAACSIENNVPQVGREQVILGREMTWIRIDRYFYGDVNSPEVSFQPVNCQHCNHAPCEAVCPVFATTHDPEGLNAMTYNRCVGTRYCANACPYKVRRFNWWTHKWGDMGKRAQDRNPRAMNPDVTVRTRGVMEKCSLCVGRLRDAKHQAKETGRKVPDGGVQTACQQTCPSNAIVFGDLHDTESRVSRARQDPRAYLMLGGDPENGHYGLKTLPNVSYLSEVVRYGSHQPEHGQPHNQ